MSTSDLLKKVSEQVKARDDVIKEIRNTLIVLSAEHAEVNKHIQACNKEASDSERKVKELISNLNQSLTKEKLQELDSARITMESAQSNPTKVTLQARSTQIEAIVDKLNVGLCQLGVK